MNRTILLLVCFLTACNYAHVGETKTTFHRTDTALTLLVRRHLDTVMSGPEVEEDQRLVLELSNYEIGKRITVPSAQARVKFDVERFGPSSEGSEFVGYVVVKKIAEKQVTVALHLDVTAHTADGRFVEHTKFRGDHVFYLQWADDD